MADGDDNSGNRKRKNPGDLQFSDDYFEAQDDDGEIKVMTVNGRLISFQVKGSDTIGTLKLKIQAKEHIAFEEQELIFNQMLLEDTDTLANLCIKKESMLKLIRKSWGLINIHINRIPTGRGESLQVKPSDTIGDVKAKIPCSDGRMLIFNENILKDGCTFADFHIANGSTLYLISKLGRLMEIFVNTFTGKTISLSVQPMYTIAKVKSMIKHRENINCDEQVLIFNNMVLGDSGTLFDFHINKKSTLKLMHKTRRFGRFMRIFIKTLAGKTITQDVKLLHSISNLKLMIQGKVDIPRDEQELIFNKMVLHDNGILVDCNIKNESTLTLMRISTGFMDIFIHMITGTIITLKVKPSHTILDVKSMIHDESSWPLYEQKLVFNGRLLADSPTLADYNIPKESTLRCFPKHERDE